MVETSRLTTGELGSVVSEWFTKARHLQGLPEFSPFYEINYIAERDDRVHMLIYKDKTLAFVIERRDDFNYIELTKVII